MQANVAKDESNKKGVQLQTEINNLKYANEKLTKSLMK